jgi:FKBP-type peptidyl-prolyl cis-trans isomerase 2
MRKKSIFLLALAIILFVAVMAGCTSSSPAVKTGDNVTIDYIINSTDGTVYQTSYAQLAKDLGIYDASADYAQYRFKVGSNTAILGIDEAVPGMKVNETKTVVVPPEKSFGKHNESLVMPYNLSDLTAANVTPYINETLGVPPYGIRARVSSIDAENNTVYLDFNRAHAGETLIIQITVRKID